jgi:anti-sigma B factor antagonist
MKLSYEDHDNTSLVRLSGELTADQTDFFRRTCSDRLAAGKRNVVLDMEHLTLIDSAGLEMLLWLMEETSERGGQLRLVRPDETVQRILYITRLDRRFDIHHSLESAAKTLR